MWSYWYSSEWKWSLNPNGFCDLLTFHQRYNQVRFLIRPILWFMTKYLSCTLCLVVICKWMTNQWGRPILFISVWISVRSAVIWGAVWGVWLLDWTINNRALRRLIGFLACPNFWLAVLQFNHFNDLISHMAAVKRSDINYS